MRTTIVPAQITTVEDRIAGSLGLSQLLLLVTPVFTGSALFVALPPFFGYAAYKVVFIVCMVVFCSTLAIRIKGKILLFWAITLMHYNARPRYYVLNKNDMHLREDMRAPQFKELPEETAVQQIIPVRLPQLSTADLVRVQNLIGSPEANVYFKTDKKGVLRVHLTENQS